MMNETPRRCLQCKLQAQHFHRASRKVDRNPVAMAINSKLPSHIRAETGFWKAHFYAEDDRFLGSSDLPEAISEMAVAYDDCGNFDVIRKDLPIPFTLSVPAEAVMRKDRYGRLIQD